MAVEVDRDDPLGFGSDKAGDALDRNAPGIRFAVGKDRSGAAIGHRIGRGHVSQARNDDFVPRRDAEAQKRQMKSHGAVTGGDGMFATQEMFEAGLECFNKPSLGRNPIAAQTFIDIGNFDPG